jgi:hypothetical protein
MSLVCECQCDARTQAQSFVCHRCERRCCPCVGANDDTPGLCNDCALAIHGSEPMTDEKRIVRSEADQRAIERIIPILTDLTGKAERATQTRLIEWLRTRAARLHADATRVPTPLARCFIDMAKGLQEAADDLEAGKEP